ncbi:alpha/beta hydrolase fold domain-containing protein [Nitratireductor sp. CAU 1489]|uniref:Alpha/beta hydrolase fold domain-containing protein n=1 Tax=Nitratireductor arenosus TaxID=2682096 RepID=A0A844QD92_9HYPH|nr:alpha/beta hydrolase [Nitratireductor arenosus]MVA96967.1 alpha/beta hydrolase fold domain-containing protein [Nitratireductor arenosus]
MTDNAMSEYKKRVAAVRAVGGGPRPTDPNIRRVQFEAYADVFKQPHPETIEVTNWFVAAPGREIPIRIYRPKQDGRQPTILYFHGGGYMSGSLYTHDTVVANIAAEAGVQVIAIHYRRAPENPYPAAVEDGWFVLNWAVRNAERYGIDIDRLALAGDSAGGGLTAALSLMARDRNGPALAMQILLYPGPMNTDLETDSYVRINHDPQFNKNDLEFYLRAYLSNDLDTEDPYAVPLKAKNYADLPPAFVHVAELDPLYDEGILWGERIKAAGGAVEVRIAKRLEHSFLRAVTISAEARTEADILYAAIRKGMKVAG